MSTSAPVSVAIGDWRDLALVAHGGVNIEVGLIAGTKVALHFDGDDVEDLQILPFGGPKDNIGAAVIGNTLHLVWSAGGDVLHSKWDLALKATSKSPAVAFPGRVPDIASFKTTRLLVNSVSAGGQHETRQSLDGGDTWTAGVAVDDAVVGDLSLSISPANDNDSSWLHTGPQSFLFTAIGNIETPAGSDLLFAPSYLGLGLNESTLTVTSIGVALPGWVTLDPATGRLTGVPAPTDLLLDGGGGPGVVSGIQLEVFDGTLTVQSSVFQVNTVGTTLPLPLMGFSFDDADLTGSDPNDTVGSNNGTTVGTVTTGVAGTIAEQFDFGGGYVTIPDAATFNAHEGANGTMTLACILTADTPHGAQEMIASKCDPATSGNREFDLIRDAAGTITILVQHPGGAGGTDGISVTTTSAIPLDAATALVAAYNPNGGPAITDKLKLYVGGLAAAVTTGSFGVFANITSGTAPFVIGETDITSNPPPNAPLDGKLDEFFYFASQTLNHALDEYQAATLAWLALTTTSVKSWIGF